MNKCSCHTRAAAANINSRADNTAQCSCFDTNTRCDMKVCTSFVFVWLYYHYLLFLAFVASVRARLNKLLPLSGIRSKLCSTTQCTGMFAALNFCDHMRALLLPKAPKLLATALGKPIAHTHDDAPNGLYHCCF
jgi:glucan phosphoethanolaminetransferase (alkaline phosphatase superfamily)